MLLLFVLACSVSAQQLGYIVPIGAGLETPIGPSAVPAVVDSAVSGQVVAEEVRTPEGTATTTVHHQVTSNRNPAVSASGVSIIPAVIIPSGIPPSRFFHPPYDPYYPNDHPFLHPYPFLHRHRFYPLVY